MAKHMEVNTVKYIANIFFLFIIFSCSSYKVIDKTNCNIRKQDIIKELKAQKAKIKEIEIGYMYKLKDIQCCSALFFFVNKWKDVTNRRTRVTGVILNTSKGVFINTYYIGSVFGWELRENIDETMAKDYINNAIQIFIKENNCMLDEEILSDIEKTFRYGISVSYPGVRWIY